MARNILFIVLTCFCSLCVYAREKKDSLFQQRAEYIVNQLCDKIAVTSGQKDNITTVFRLYFEDIRTYRAEGNESLMRALGQTRDGNIKDILSNDILFNDYLRFIEGFKPQKRNTTQQSMVSIPK